MKNKHRKQLKDKITGESQALERQLTKLIQQFEEEGCEVEISQQFFSVIRKSNIPALVDDEEDVLCDSHDLEIYMWLFLKGFRFGKLFENRKQYEKINKHLVEKRKK